MEQPKTVSVSDGSLLRAAALLLLISAGCFINAGCARSFNREGQGAPAAHGYVGIDTSGSWEPYLAASAQGAAHVGALLDPDRDRLSVYRLDARCDQFYDGAAPDSADAFQDELVGELQALPGRSGTFPVPFWTTVATAACKDRGPVTVVLFSDGDNDDMTAGAERQIRAAAQALAANPRVASVAVLGASPDNWAKLKSEFSPLGARFHLCSPHGLSKDAVDQVFAGQDPADTVAR